MCSPKLSSDSVPGIPDRAPALRGHAVNGQTRATSGPDMDLERLRRTCEERVDALGLPHRFNTRDLCDAVAEKRGRPIILRPPSTLGAIDAPCGIRLETPDADLLFFLLHRRVIEINDGVLALRPHRSAHVQESAERAAAARGGLRPYDGPRPPASPRPPADAAGGRRDGGGGLVALRHPRNPGRLPRRLRPLPSGQHPTPVAHLAPRLTANVSADFDEVQLGEEGALGQGDGVPAGLQRHGLDGRPPLAPRGVRVRDGAGVGSVDGQAVRCRNR